MYGSKSDKARGTRLGRSEEACLRYLGNGRLKGRDDRDKREAIGEQVTAMLDEHETTTVRDCESVDFNRFEINRLHAEALRMHEQWWEDRLDDPPLDLADWEAELVIGGLPEDTSVAWSTEINDSEDPDYGDYEGCWLPFMRIEELRDTFGHNWLGNGFHIIDGNSIRRNP